MKYAQVSLDRLYATVEQFSVDMEYAEPIANYLLNGWQPGGFFTSLLANDAMGAIARSHPANRIENLKLLVTWIVNCAPKVAYGSYEQVEKWCNMSAEQRRAVLIEANLVYSEQDETFITLQKK